MPFLHARLASILPMTESRRRSPSMKLTLGLTAMRNQKIKRVVMYQCQLMK